MYMVTTHSFNESGHYHYQMFFEDYERKDRLLYLRTQIEEYIAIGFSVVEVNIYLDEGKNWCSYYRLVKKEEHGLEYAVEISEDKIVSKHEYTYEC